MKDFGGYCGIILGMVMDCAETTGSRLLACGDIVVS